MNVNTPCANPPGFSITCNHTQLAICGTVNGEVVMGCFDPPPPGSRMSDQAKTLQLANWAIQRVTGEQRDQNQYVSPSESRMLEKGFYRNDYTGEEVRFRMPREDEEKTPQVAQMAR